jgi:DNA-binding MarR family transcriptional regulator
MENSEICNCGLTRKLSSKMTSIYNKALKDCGITITQFALLKYIHLLEETNLTTLNTMSHQDRSTLGRNIRVIENLELVKSKVGRDKREVIIEITDLGKKKFKSAYLIWERINKNITKFLGKEKQSQLIKIIKDINNLYDTEKFT